MFVTLLLGINLLGIGATPVLRHEISMPSPHTHYFQVKTSVDLSQRHWNKPYVDFKMAAWTPGSYLIREFARNVESLMTLKNGTLVPVEKINKNTWRVYLAKGQKQVSISYDVYAFELSVRTSFLDDTHGYINPASVLLYVNELAQQAHSVQINPHKSFQRISTALKQTAAQTFEAKNLDELIDSPIEIGNHQLFEFKVGNIPHQIAFYGPAKVDTTKFIADVKKMCEEAARVIGQHPCDHYLFIIHNLQKGSGGLEHLYSTTCQVARTAYETENGYHGILGLLSHEYFHLWNVKRIRPKALGPFDYENENYTHNLWLSEGMTSYYGALILQRSGQTNTDAYLKGVADEITTVENTPGNKIESAASASWDAWIKYYRPNENSRNSTVSYYSKGSVLGTVLNLWIIKHSQGKANLDDVFRYLYQNYYVKQQRGFTDAELENAFSLVAGISAKSIFEQLVYGTVTPDYTNLFKEVGYEWVNANLGKSTPYLGFTVIAGKISTVLKGSTAYDHGLNVGDEVLKVNAETFESVDKTLKDKHVGDTILFTVRRDGLERTLAIPVGKSNLAAYKISSLPNLKESQKTLRMKWLGKIN
ncbi:peptidase M61 [Aquirufa sp. 1-SAACH-A3]|uniref:Peptidase M61 n=1 Tax=Aquirufa salirivi TaxID=3104729 RepID=A0ABW8RTK4_9BACT